LSQTLHATKSIANGPRPKKKCEREKRANLMTFFTIKPFFENKSRVVLDILQRYTTSAAFEGLIEIGCL
jgi:hypothetical protein